MIWTRWLSAYALNVSVGEKSQTDTYRYSPLDMPRLHAIFPPHTQLIPNTPETIAMIYSHSLDAPPARAQHALEQVAHDGHGEPVAERAHDSRVGRDAQHGLDEARRHA